jgi:hypothetical protein
VRAVIVGHEELAVEVEDGERQIVPLDLEHGSNVYVGATRAESIAPAIALRRTEVLWAYPS